MKGFLIAYLFMINAIVFRINTVEIVSKFDSAMTTSEAMFMIVVRSSKNGVSLDQISTLMTVVYTKLICNLKNEWFMS